MDDTEKQFQELNLNEHRLDFEETGNPLYVWDSIRIALTAGEEVPAWCRDYLLRVSKSITGLQEPSEMTDKRKIEMQVKDALQIDGNHVKEFRKFLKHYTIWEHVHDLCIYGLPLKTAIEETAGAFNLSVSRTTDIYYLIDKTERDFYNPT